MFVLYISRCMRYLSNFITFQLQTPAISITRTTISCVVHKICPKDMTLRDNTPTLVRSVLACHQVRLMSLGQADVVACCLDAQKDIKGHVPVGRSVCACVVFVDCCRCRLLHEIEFNYNSFEYR